MRIATQKIDLNLLVVFDVIYRERNLTRASEVLRVTQPAVSNALRRLREALDNPLFYSTPTGMVPTPEADRMIGRVREALTTIDAALQGISGFEPYTSTKSFRFSMNDFAEALILPKLMNRLAQCAPSMSILTQYVPRDEAERELASGQLDFVVDAPLPMAVNLCSLPLISESYVCVMNNMNPLGKATLDLDTYLAADHIHVSSRRYGRGQIDLTLDKLGRRRNIKLRVPHYLIAGLVVQSNDLLWSVPRALALDYSMPLFELPFDSPLLDCHLYWHERMNDDSANQWMRNTLTSLIEEHYERHTYPSAI